MNEMTIANEMIAQENEKRKPFCTAIMDTAEEKAKWFSATNNPDKKVADCANAEIYLKDFYIEFVDCLNEESGELTMNVPRIVLMDVDGVSYTATSFVLYNTLERLVRFYGLPNQWDEPLRIKFKQINKGKKRLLSIDVV